MHERTCVQQFYHRSGVIGRIFHFSADFGTQKHKHRTHLFAFALHDIIHYGIQKRHFCTHNVPKPMLKFGKFGLDTLIDGGYWHSSWLIGDWLIGDWVAQGLLFVKKQQKRGLITRHIYFR
jgi:hypothetical protein